MFGAVCGIIGISWYLLVDWYISHQRRIRNWPTTFQFWLQISQSLIPLIFLIIAIISWRGIVNSTQ
jgi:hypothetical protein